MIIAGIGLGRPSTAALDGYLQAAQASALNYDHAGSTLPGSPSRPGVRRYSRALGAGAAVQAAAVDALRTWVPQRGIGALVHPDDAPVAEGTTVVLVVPLGPVRLLVPNRVTAVIDEADRFVFAYGTLPGHPERGEESFTVERAGSGSVTFTVSVESTAGRWISRLGGPITHRLQHRAIDGYLEAMARHVAGAATPPDR